MIRIPRAFARTRSLILGLALAGALGSLAGAQESRAVFDAAVVQVTEAEVPFRRLLDYDGDGDLDAAGIWNHQNKEKYRWAVYENDGQGVFAGIESGQVALDSVAAKFLIEAGRLDDNAFEDFVVFSGEERREFYSRGDGTFFEAVTPMAYHPRGALLADLTGDGIDEIIWADRHELHVQVEGGTLSSAHSFGFRVGGLRSLDADGDAHPDLLLAGSDNTREVQIFHGSLGGPVAGQIFVHGLFKPMVDVADVDGDLDTDIVVFGQTSYRVLRRTGASSWNLEDEVVGGPAEYLRDVDGDGDPDGVCCGGGGGDPPYHLNEDRTDFQIALNDGTGAFAPSFSIPGLGSPQLAGAEDVDGDGDTDLVAGRCVYYSRGTIEPPLMTEPGFQLPPANSMRDVCDVDEDGDLDMGLCLDEVWVNDGRGYFVEEAPPIQPAIARKLLDGPGFPGDFDGDGDTDLLVRYRPTLRPGSGAVAPWHLRLLGNDGGGSFFDGGRASPRATTPQLEDLRADASRLGDVDGDGDLDLITRPPNYTGESLRWMNDGSGFFVPIGTIPGHRIEHIGDLDDDGVADLITTKPQYQGSPRQTPAVFKGILNGSVPTYNDVTDLVIPFAYGFDAIDEPMVFADIDQEGHLDMAFIFTFPLMFLDMQGYGQVGYSANASMDPGVVLTQDARVVVGDLDEDTWVDALIGPVAGGELIMAVRHKRDFTWYFWPETTLQLTGKGLLIDVDTDGDLDVLGEQLVFNAGP